MSLPLFLIPIVVGLAAQALKPLLNKEWYATIKPAGKKLPRYGGMPSAHAAFAISLTTVVGLAEGIMSAPFAIATALAILIFDDALRMRIFLSRHGLALSQLIRQLPPAQQQQFPYLETRLGHKPSEVFAGALLGFALSLLLYYAL